MPSGERRSKPWGSALAATPLAGGARNGRSKGNKRRFLAQNSLLLIVNSDGKTHVHTWQEPGMNLNLDKLPINLFDLVVLVVLTAGIARGRKHGMSEELIALLQWLCILFGCSAVYEWGGDTLGSFTGVFGRLSRYLMAYVAAALTIVLFFTLIRRGLGGKLLGSDVFGRTEYYLGMASGVVRFCCILLVALALLNARYFSPTEVRAMEKYQDDVYGSNFFPTLHSMQDTVFEKSMCGPFIKKYFGNLLIKPTQPETNEFHQKEFAVP
jgi:hypothetical protein